MAKRGGRRSDREIHWRRVLGRWTRSGLGVAAFCQRERIRTPSFYVWKRRLKDSPPSRSPRSSPSPAFLPLGTWSPSASPGGQVTLEVVLRGGRLLRVTGGAWDARAVAEMVEALDGKPC